MGEGALRGVQDAPWGPSLVPLLTQRETMSVRNTADSAFNSSCNWIILKPRKEVPQAVGMTELKASPLCLLPFPLCNNQPTELSRG